MMTAPITRPRGDPAEKAGERSPAAPAANRHIAGMLRQAADLLEGQGANRFRIEAYRRAADTIEGLDADLSMVAAGGGREALAELPHIGDGFAGAIVEIVDTGRWRTLERLRGSFDPVSLFEQLPGVGPKLARRIHESLEVDSFEELEEAAHDGRLEEVDGIGHNRVAGIRAAIESRLQSSQTGRRMGEQPEPEVETLLDVDREYRSRAEAGELHTVAPRRHNPDGEAWLPVLHAERGGWRFHARFSNTARAHMLDRTDDWVVMAFENEEGSEGQVTVLTERRGPLAEKRVVRGREIECMDHYGIEAGSPAD
ncbi:MAG: helix-hairpin-helix domain-containing protein [Holophagae bacterium]|jgi:putative hydrolase